MVERLACLPPDQHISCPIWLWCVHTFSECNIFMRPKLPKWDINCNLLELSLKQLEQVITIILIGTICRQACLGVEISNHQLSPKDWENCILHLNLHLQLDLLHCFAAQNEITSTTTFGFTGSKKMDPTHLNVSTMIPFLYDVWKGVTYCGINTIHAIHRCQIPVLT